jgi:2-hydroxy-6-oxonona-2,4-dienedioate hydrolase
MQAGTAEVNGTTLYFETTGKGLPFVFVSGGGIMDRRCWDEQFHFFARDYQVIRYDVRGIGRSARPDRPFSHSSDLYELLKFMKIERIHLAGLSVGGAMAIDFAIEHPEMVDHLILAASSLSDDVKGEANLQALQMLSVFSEKKESNR